MLEAHGGILVYAKEFFESSKICSKCGHKNLKLERDVEFWTCENCGEIHDRNVNAGKNLVNYYIQNRDQIVSNKYKTELKFYDHPKFQGIDCSRPKSKNKKKKR